MTKQEAIERIKARFDKLALDDKDIKAIQTLIPELHESEDEKIIRAIINALYSHTNSINLLSSRGYQMEDIEAWLEKQKDISKAIEAVERIDNYITEHTANSWEMDDSNPDKKYYCGVDDTLANIAWILQDVYLGEKEKEQTEELSIRLNGLMQEYVKSGKDEEDQEHRLKCYQLFWDALGDSEFFKQKEQKPEFYPGDVIKCTSSGSLWVRCKDGDNIRSDGHTACIGGGFELASEEEAVQFFQELNENGYQWDCIKGRPMKKEQKPLITGNDFGWIDELKHDLKHPEELDEKVDDVLKQRKGIRTVEWSEEDERHLIWLCRIIHSRVVNKELSLAEESQLGKWIDKWINHGPQPVQKWDEFNEDCLKRAIWYVENPAPSVVKDTNLVLWLKSLRPSWKPSKEQMCYLKKVYESYDFCDGERDALEALYNDLKKLM